MISVFETLKQLLRCCEKYGALCTKCGALVKLFFILLLLRPNHIFFYNFLLLLVDYDEFHLHTPYNFSNLIRPIFFNFL